MEKVYKHRKTGELAYYKDGIFKQGRFCVEIGVEPSSEFWTELTKESILTTFDGVELFYQDVYYFIWLNKPAHGQEVNKIYKAIVRPLDGYTAWSSDAVFFSTKELAEEYILMNKPLLSLNDLLSVWGSEKDFDVYKESPMFQNFKNLAKTKL